MIKRDTKGKDRTESSRMDVKYILLFSFLLLSPTLHAIHSPEIAEVVESSDHSLGTGLYGITDEVGREVLRAVEGETDLIKPEEPVVDVGPVNEHADDFIVEDTPSAPFVVSHVDDDLTVISRAEPSGTPVTTKPKISSCDLDMCPTSPLSIAATVMTYLALASVTAMFIHAFLLKWKLEKAVATASAGRYTPRAYAIKTLYTSRLD